MKLRHLLIGLVTTLAFVLPAASFAQTLTIAQGAPAVTLDPHNATEGGSGIVTVQLYEPLFMMTPEGEVVPHLASGYELSEDGRTLTIDLREDVVFHDGTPLDAEIVKGSLERFLDPEEGIPFRFLLDPIQEVTVEDASTVALHLDEPFAPLVSHLSHGSTAIVLPAALEEHGDEFFRNPVGTGPFVFDVWEPNQHVELTRFEDYWGNAPEVERLRIVSVPENTTRMALLESGEADIAMGVPAQDIARLDALPDVSVLNVPSVRTIYGYFNVTREPFDDARVRRAINHAVDKATIAEFVTGGAAIPSDAAVAPGIFGHVSVGAYEYDPELARELLAEAGYPDGFQTTFYSPSGRYLQDIQVAETIQGMLAEVGIEAEVETAEWATYLQVTGAPAEENEVPMGVYGWSTVTGDADYGLLPLFHTSQHVPAGSNRGFYSNPELDALLDEGRTSTDPERRLEVYEEALRIVHEEAPWLFLHVQSQLLAVSDAVEGLVVLPTERLVLDDVRLN